MRSAIGVGLGSLESLESLEGLGGWSSKLNIRNLDQIIDAKTTSSPQTPRAGHS